MNNELRMIAEQEGRQVVADLFIRQQQGNEGRKKTAKPPITEDVSPAERAVTSPKYLTEVDIAHGKKLWSGFEGYRLEESMEGRKILLCEKLMKEYEAPTILATFQNRVIFKSGGFIFENKYEINEGMVALTEPEQALSKEINEQIINLKTAGLYEGKKPPVIEVDETKLTQRQKKDQHIGGVIDGKKFYG